MYESLAMESQLTGHSSVCPKGCSNNHQGHMNMAVHLCHKRDIYAAAKIFLPRHN